MIKLKGGMCRWPFGDPVEEDFHFCGNPSEHSLSYCQEHMALAHAPSRKPVAFKPALSNAEK
jgi:GcrA cell cycle regulator